MIGRTLFPENARADTMEKNPISRWLRVPAVADPVDRRNAPLLQVVLLALGTLPPALWLYRILGTDIPWRPGETVSLGASVLVSVLALWCVLLIRRGRFQTAVRRLMAVVAAVTVASHAINGLAAHMFEMPILVLWLFVAGMMIGRRALWAMYGALALALLLGALAEDRLGRIGLAHALGDAVIRSVMFLLIALVVDRSVAALRESLREALAHGEQLERANAQLRAEMAARERAQSQLLHSQRMEAAGRMASGLAHDFGHLLTLINGYAARAAKAPSQEERAAALDGVRSAAARANAVVRKLLHFARRDVAMVEGFDATEALREVEPMLRQTLGAGIRFDFRPPDGPAPIRVDREQFALALLNIAANAADAMPDGGRFSLHARIADGTTLDIALRDDGDGIPEPLRERVFEPFFTTKPEDRGTGLGLAVSRDLVHAAGGTLTLEPGEGGAAFRLRLPLWRPEATGAA